MAIAIGCDINSIVKNGACFNCSQSTLVSQAMLVFLLEQIRAKKAGVAARTANQLRAAAACINCAPIDQVADGLDVGIAQQWAVNSGVAGASTLTISQLRASANAFSNMALDDLRAIEMVIRCGLASF